MPTSKDVPASNLRSCLSTLQSIDQSSFTNDGERNEALLAAYALVSRLETPWDTMHRTALGQVKTPHHPVVPGLGFIR